MKRRDFLRNSAIVTAGALLGGDAYGRGAAERRGSAERTPASRHGPPNILFIMTDQQSAHMMSCAGNPWLKTPAMDSLAASGIRFERAYASNPVCMPSRFSLQTGRLPSAIDLGTNDDSPRPRLTETIREQSLGRLFSRAGYEAVYGGKVHLPHGMSDIRELGYRNLTADSRQELADACADYLRGKHTRPFFLFASFINPHDICYMAINARLRATGASPVANRDSETVESVLEQARGSGDLGAFVANHCPPLPGNYGIPDREPECITRKYVEAAPFRAYVRAHWTDLEWRLHRWAYCRLTEMVDAQIGKVLEALRETGLDDNTLIVFTSDHGDMDSAHKLEHKSVLYEEAVHIPLVLSYRGPSATRGAIPAGTVDKVHFVSNGLDLLPTLCDYAGLRKPDGLPGASLLPLAAQRHTGWRDFVAAESQNGRMLRTEQYKYCVYDSGQYREQFIDIQSDPGEMHNLAEPDEKARKTAQKALNAHRKRLRKWVPRVEDSTGAQYIL